MRKNRHKSGVEILKAAIVRAWKGEAKFPKEFEMGTYGTVVKRGNRILDVAGHRVERFADIVVELQGNEFWIDVTFVNPGSSDSRSRGSLIRGGRAAEYREHTKKPCMRWREEQAT